MMNKEKADRLLKGKDYKFAKSMPKDPHAYTMFYDWGSRKTFEAVVQFIRDNGKREHWNYGKYYIYYYLDGYKYWTMGYDLPTTKLINRAKVVEPIPDEEFTMLNPKYNVDEFSKD